MKRIASAFAVMLAALLSATLQAAPILLVANLTGDKENPPNNSPGFGTAVVTLDDDANTLRVQIVFGDLIGTTTASHIHCCVDPPGNIGVATELPSFTGFPLGVTSGTYDHTFDTSLLASFSPNFLAANGGTAEGAEDALFAGIIAGRAYLNIHTTFRPGGEIRGFFAVPEPSTLLLLGVATLIGGALRRRSR
jgi:CHRD domain/PEP-CTERM motif